MLQILLIALLLATVDKAAENLLNEIKQIIYFCIEQKKLLKRYAAI